MRKASMAMRFRTSERVSSVDESSITMMSVFGTCRWISSSTVQMFAASLCVGTIIKVRMRTQDYSG